MSKNLLIGLGFVVAIIILLVLIGLVVQGSRRRRVEADHAEANELRAEANRAGRARLVVSEQEGSAVGADAHARRARAETEKFEREAAARIRAARAARDRAEEQLRWTMELDPDDDDLRPKVDADPQPERSSPRRVGSDDQHR